MKKRSIFNEMYTGAWGRSPAPLSEEGGNAAIGG
jgi:hypothetical protein